MAHDDSDGGPKKGPVDCSPVFVPSQLDVDERAGSASGLYDVVPLAWVSISPKDQLFQDHLTPEWQLTA